MLLLTQGRLICPRWGHAADSASALALARPASSYSSHLKGGKYNRMTLFEGVSANRAVGKRMYSNLGPGWSFRRLQYTKYRITKPWTSDTQFDDLILSEPSRDAFAKFTKEAPLFLRFLKLITDVENRQQAFIDFAKRCENGLVVEKDVFISKEELMECIWKNGYSENEMNAFEIAFPSNYRFHYPELAVLFDLCEEDCYRYCIRQRAASPETLVELKYEKPKNLLSSYGLCFLGVWYGFSNQVLSNAWFYSKTFPFGATFYILASYFYRNIKEYAYKEEISLIRTSQEKKNAGEDLVYKQMKKYTSDTRCLDFLASFKHDIQQQIADYHNALADSLRAQIIDRLNGKLLAIQQAEKAIKASLQEVIVHAIVDSFKDCFKSSQQLREEAIQSAIQSIGGDIVSMDPVGAHFASSLRNLSEQDLSISPTNGNSVVERVASVFQRREKEFLDNFSVRSEEAHEIREITSKCNSSGGHLDFSKLSDNDLVRLNGLRDQINRRIGFESVSDEDLHEMNTVKQESRVIDHVNNQVVLARANIKIACLTSFVRAFV